MVALVHILSCFNLAPEKTSWNLGISESQNFLNLFQRKTTVGWNVCAGAYISIWFQRKLCGIHCNVFSSCFQRKTTVGWNGCAGAAQLTLPLTSKGSTLPARNSELITLSLALCAILMGCKSESDSLAAKVPTLPETVCSLPDIQATSDCGQ